MFYNACAVLIITWKNYIPLGINVDVLIKYILFLFRMDSESRSSIVSPSTLCSFFTLAVIRGTFAVTVHYGIEAYDAPSLLFLLRTPGTVALFVISVLYLASKEEEVKHEIVNDLKNSRSYKRAALLGFTQLCGPYLLFMYAMKYFSPTLGGVFMAATPWATAFLDEILVVTIQVHVCVLQNLKVKNIYHFGTF